MSCTEYRFLKTNFNFELILILILKLKTQIYLVRRTAIKQKEKATGYQTNGYRFKTANRKERFRVRGHILQGMLSLKARML